MVVGKAVDVPVGLNPVTSVLAAVQSKVTGIEMLVLIFKSVVAPEHIESEPEINFASGEGFTVMAIGASAPVQPAALGFIVKVMMPGALLVLFSNVAKAPVATFVPLVGAVIVAVPAPLATAVQL